MDDPAEWDRLTAAIESVPSAQPGWLWAFLVLQGLVEHTLAAEAEFLRLYQHARGEPNGAGPSLGFRLAAALRYAGIALPRASEPDPYGREARNHAQTAGRWQSQ
jgi:hypothetical protein